MYTTQYDKYNFKPNSNPPVGCYDADKAKDYLKPKPRGAVIKEATSTYRRPLERLPEPGQYDSHLKPFGTIS